MGQSKEFINAAQYALNNYYLKPYKSMQNFGVWIQGGRRIERPYHGLAHTLRKVSYIPLLADAWNTKDSGEKITDKDLAQMKIAMLFYVTGKESESSEDNARQKARADSANNFIKYAKENPALFSDNEIKKYASIISEQRNFNNYGIDINQLKEFHVLRFAHAADLLRTHAHMFFDPKPDGGGQGPAVTFKERFGENFALHFSEYVRDLSIATGEQVVISTDAQERALLNLEPLQQPANFERAFECSRSVEQCLKNIDSVQNPLIKNPVKIKKITRIIDPKDEARLNELNAEQNTINLELNALNDIKNILENDEEKNVNEYNQVVLNITALKAKLEQIEKEQRELQVTTPEKRYFGNGDYEIIVKNKLFEDGILKDEIRIPTDNNCCYNAAFTAACQAGVQLPENIKNHKDLRAEVARRLRENAQNGHYMEDAMKAAIEGYNSEFHKDIATFNEYIAEVERLGSWGGEFELKMMSQILNVEIVTHGRNYAFTIDNPGREIIHLQHTGSHYNVLVEPNTWAGRDYNIYPANQIASLAVEIDQKTKMFQNDLVVNYFKYSEILKRKMEPAAAPDNLEEIRNANLQINKIRSMLEKQNPDPAGWFFEQYKSLMSGYDSTVETLRSVDLSLMDLQKKLGRAKDNQRADIQKLILGKMSERENYIKIIKKNANDLEKQIEFTCREGEIWGRDFTNEIVKFQAKKLELMKLLSENKQESEKKDENSVALKHLQEFLKLGFDEKKSLKDNIRQYFQEQSVKNMIIEGGEFVGGFAALEKPENERVYIYANEKDKYNDELLENFVEQMTQMVEAERGSPNTVALYNAASANLSVGNDVIRSLTTLLEGQNIRGRLRLFSEDFKEFSNAEEFRNNIYTQRNLMDDAVDFQKRGLSCGVSPFQCLTEESPLDFWVHNRNVQTFDRWEKEILPKLKEVITDQKILFELTEEYKDLINLSDQLGARINQFLLKSEDADNFAWISGGYGFQVPSIKYQNGALSETNKLSEALACYKEKPDDFVNQTVANIKLLKEKTDAKVSNKIYSDDPGLGDDTPIKRRQYLAQLQARLYLHPDLFQPGRMELNTYYSLPTEPALLEDYNRRVAHFSQKLCEQIIKNKEQLKNKEGIPEELLKSKHFAVFKYDQKLLDMIGVPVIEAAAQDPILLNNDIIVKNAIDDTNPINQILLSKNITHQALEELIKNQGNKDTLANCFYSAIENNNEIAFGKLLDFYRTYHIKKNDKNVLYGSEYPIDFNKLKSAKGKEANALILASKNNHSEIFKQLIQFRNNDHGKVAKLIYQLPVQSGIIRTAQETETGLSTLHYLAQNGNVDGFMMITNSLLKDNISWLSYLSSYQGNIKDIKSETPLSILALGDQNEELVKNRIEILNQLLKGNPALFDKLFAADALTTPNAQGISPIMIAALTQNFQAIEVFSTKIGLSENQKNFYNWLASNPQANLRSVLQENDFGRIPGFVESNKIENLYNIQEKRNNQASRECIPPKTIDELKRDLTDSLVNTNNRDMISKNFKELKAATEIGSKQYLKELLLESSQHQNMISLNNILNLVKDCNIPSGVFAFDDKTNSALSVATEAGHFQAVKLLLGAKAALGVQRTTQDKNQNTPLHYLVGHEYSKEQAETVSLLLDKTGWVTSYLPGMLTPSTIDPTRILNSEGDTPLHIIARNGNIELLKYINKHQESKGFYAKGNDGLYQSLYYSSLIPNKEGKTPIMIALEKVPLNEGVILLLCKTMGLNKTDESNYLQYARLLSQGGHHNVQNQIDAMQKDILPKLPGWNVKPTSVKLKG